MTAADDLYGHYLDADSDRERLTIAAVIDMRVDKASYAENVGDDRVKRVAIMRRCVLAHHNAAPWWRA